mmetsp:Transcript_20463/g.40933  ORF Transcript_20463/g.40933 Transcript_20463/m.40933 type:complete len:103 (-) Transcript_20463:1064-1372(-)
MTPIAPITLTSRTPGRSLAGASSRESWEPIASTRAFHHGPLSGFPSSAGLVKRFRLSRATAQARGLAVKVGPCIKGRGGPSFGGRDKPVAILSVASVAAEVM